MQVMRFTPHKLKECREAKDISIDNFMIELSKIGLTVARNTLINWESGDTEPDPSDLAIIASFYKKPIQYFFASNTK